MFNRNIESRYVDLEQKDENIILEPFQIVHIDNFIKNQLFLTRKDTCSYEIPDDMPEDTTVCEVEIEVNQNVFNNLFDFIDEVEKLRKYQILSTATNPTLQAELDTKLKDGIKTHIFYFWRDTNN